MWELKSLWVWGYDFFLSLYLIVSKSWLSTHSFVFNMCDHIRANCPLSEQRKHSCCLWPMLDNLQDSYNCLVLQWYFWGQYSRFRSDFQYWDSSVGYDSPPVHVFTHLLVPTGVTGDCVWVFEIALFRTFSFSLFRGNRAIHLHTVPILFSSLI